MTDSILPSHSDHLPAALDNTRGEVATSAALIPYSGNEEGTVDPDLSAHFQKAALRFRALQDGRLSSEPDAERLALGAISDLIFRYLGPVQFRDAGTAGRKRPFVPKETLIALLANPAFVRDLLSLPALRAVDRLPWWLSGIYQSEEIVLSPSVDPGNAELRKKGMRLGFVFQRNEGGGHSLKVTEVQRDGKWGHPAEIIAAAANNENFDWNDAAERNPDFRREVILVSLEDLIMGKQLGLKRVRNGWERGMNGNDFLRQFGTLDLPRRLSEHPFLKINLADEEEFIFKGRLGGEVQSLELHRAPPDGSWLDVGEGCFQVRIRIVPTGSGQFEVAYPEGYGRNHEFVIEALRTPSFEPERRKPPHRLKEAGEALLADIPFRYGENENYLYDRKAYLDRFGKIDLVQLCRKHNIRGEFTIAGAILKEEVGSPGVYEGEGPSSLRKASVRFIAEESGGRLSVAVAGYGEDRANRDVMLGAFAFNRSVNWQRTAELLGRDKLEHLILCGVSDFILNHFGPVRMGPVMIGTRDNSYLLKERILSRLEDPAFAASLKGIAAFQALGDGESTAWWFAGRFESREVLLPSVEPAARGVGGEKTGLGFLMERDPSKEFHLRVTGVHQRRNMRGLPAELLAAAAANPEFDWGDSSEKDPDYHRQIAVAVVGRLIFGECLGLKRRLGGWQRKVERKRFLDGMSRLHLNRRISAHSFIRDTFSRPLEFIVKGILYEKWADHLEVYPAPIDGSWLDLGDDYFQVRIRIIPLQRGQFKIEYPEGAGSNHSLVLESLRSLFFNEQYSLFKRGPYFRTAFGKAVSLAMERLIGRSNNRTMADDAADSMLRAAVGIHREKDKRRAALLGDTILNLVTNDPTNRHLEIKLEALKGASLAASYNNIDQLMAYRGFSYLFFNGLPSEQKRALELIAKNQSVGEEEYFLEDIRKEHPEGTYSEATKRWVAKHAAKGWLTKSPKPRQVVPERDAVVDSADKPETESSDLDTEPTTEEEVINTDTPVSALGGPNAFNLGAATVVTPSPANLVRSLITR